MAGTCRMQNAIGETECDKQPCAALSRADQFEALLSASDKNPVAVAVSRKGSKQTALPA